MQVDMSAPAPGWCARSAGPASEEQGLERCEPLVCCRMCSGVLAGLIGTLFILIAAGNCDDGDDRNFLQEQCGAVDAIGDTNRNRDDAYYYDNYDGYGCSCEDIMPLQANGYGSHADQCQLRFGGEGAQKCCADHQNSTEFFSFIGFVFAIAAPFLITGGWLGVCGVLGDGREACASCNRVVTDEPSPCCWRDCTMIWVTPVWLFLLISMPMHAVKSRGWSAGDNAAWLYWAALIHFAYLVFTVVFAVSPCIPPGHDLASRRARLTGKVVDQCTCAAICVFIAGLFFALISFGFTDEDDYSLQCCACVEHGVVVNSALDESTGAKMMNFALKTRNFVSKTRNFLSTTRNFVSKTRIVLCLY